MPTPPKKQATSPTFKTSLSKTSKSDSSAKMPAAKKTPSFSDPTPLPKFDPNYNKATVTRAAATNAANAASAARAKAKLDDANAKQAARKTKTVSDANDMKFGGRRGKIDRMIKNF